MSSGQVSVPNEFWHQIHNNNNKVASVIYSIHLRIEGKCFCTSTTLFWERCAIITFASVSLLSALSTLRNSRISVKVSSFFTELCIQNDKSFNFFLINVPLAKHLLKL